MALRRLYEPLGPGLDGFLFAAPGRNGTVLLKAMISALAQLGLDPWAEASSKPIVVRDRAWMKPMVSSGTSNNENARLALLDGFELFKGEPDLIGDRTFCGGALMLVPFLECGVSRGSRHKLLNVTRRTG
jgi:hypothetical protein